jgi:hypothetical protein
MIDALPRNTTMDMQQFLANRCQFPPEELARFAGKYVAWSPDGTRILTSDDELEKVAATILAQGIDPDEVVLGFVPSPAEVVLGGGVLFGAGTDT